MAHEARRRRKKRGLGIKVRNERRRNKDRERRGSTLRAKKGCERVEDQEEQIVVCFPGNGNGRKGRSVGEKIVRTYRLRLVVGGKMFLLHSSVFLPCCPPVTCVAFPHALTWRGPTESQIPHFHFGISAGISGTTSSKFISYPTALVE